MFIISCNEEDLARKILYKCFPISDIVCEIGVAMGFNAETILSNAKPKVLHLIDPWLHIEDSEYISDPNNTSNEVGEERYRGVLEKFKNEIGYGQVMIHRNFSYNVCKKFPDKFFDWIFVDATHTYEGAKKDLDLYKNKIKDIGFLMVHDYTNHQAAHRMNFGVIEAVTDFCKETDFEISIITNDSYGSCVLSRKENPWNNQLIKNVLSHFRFIIQMKNVKFNQVTYIENELQCVIMTIE